MGEGPTPHHNGASRNGLWNGSGTTDQKQEQSPIVAECSGFLLK